MIALVTGGSRGIGLGIAKALAGCGYSVVISGRRPPSEVVATVNSLSGNGVEAEYVQADVCSAADRLSLLKLIEARFGRLDVLVNNAGIAPRVRADILEASEASFDELIATNLKGPYFLTQLCARWMIRQKQADPAYIAWLPLKRPPSRCSTRRGLHWPPSRQSS